ncbi:Protein of unknown function [Gryllus bimaculatus]|nr:Protein of unknown function [Gryllus bimaculatus]
MPRRAVVLAELRNPAGAAAPRGLALFGTLRISVHLRYLPSLRLPLQGAHVMVHLVLRILLQLEDTFFRPHLRGARGDAVTTVVATVPMPGRRRQMELKESKISSVGVNMFQMSKIVKKRYIFVTR